MLVRLQLNVIRACELVVFGQQALDAGAKLFRLVCRRRQAIPGTVGLGRPLLISRCGFKEHMGELGPQHASEQHRAGEDEQTEDDQGKEETSETTDQFDIEDDNADKFEVSETADAADDTKSVKDEDQTRLADKEDVKNNELFEAKDKPEIRDSDKDSSPLIQDNTEDKKKSGTEDKAEPVKNFLSTSPKRAGLT